MNPISNPSVNPELINTYLYREPSTLVNVILCETNSQSSTACIFFHKLSKIEIQVISTFILHMYMCNWSAKQHFPNLKTVREVIRTLWQLLYFPPFHNFRWIVPFETRFIILRKSKLLLELYFIIIPKYYLQFNNNLPKCFQTLA